MPAKRVYAIMVLLAILIAPSFFSLPMTTQASPIMPTMYVAPPSIVDPAKTSGFNFTVDLLLSDSSMADQTDVYAWQVAMVWNPEVIDVDDEVAWGDFMDQPRRGSWGELTTDAAAEQTIVNVADGTKFQAGYAVVIEDDSSKETNQIVSVLDNQLIMLNALSHTYSADANGGCYPMPDLTPATSVNHGIGRIIAGQTTNGPAPGVSGSGWLCTLTFTVLVDAGETILDINDTALGQYTYIINTLGVTLGDDEGELNKGSGYFSNMMAVPRWHLAVNSTPIDAVGFALDGSNRTTPFSDNLTEGDHILMMPTSWTVGDDIYTFVAWEDNTTNPTRIVSLTANTTVTAFYEFYTPVEYTLTIAASGGGTTNPEPGISTHAASASVDVAAVANGGWIFDHWTLDGVEVGSANPYTVTMDADHLLMAFFVEVPVAQYSLTIDVIGSGTTDPAPGNNSYAENTIVEITATPNGDWAFDHWTLDGTHVGSANPYILTVDANHTLVAFFVVVQRTLVIEVAGNGTTNPTPGSYHYPEGALVNVTALPADGWILAHWMLDGVNVGSANPYTVTMNADHNLSLHLIVETAPILPHVTIISPENKTYTTTSVALTFTIDTSTSWIGYSLDAQANVTISGNTTLTSLADGTHSIVVYANDTAAKAGASDVIYFTIDSLQPEPPPFPLLTWVVVGIIVISGAGTILWLYLRRRRNMS